MRHLLDVGRPDDRRNRAHLLHHRRPEDQVRAAAPRAAVARPGDGPAVREAVAADPRELRGGMAHLGGSSLFLGQDVGFGSRESIADFGRVLSEYVDVIVVRANSPPDGRRTGRALHLLGHQRADRLRPPLPGHGRSVHDPRVGRRPARRADARLDRRRQQRGPQPRHGLRQAGHEAGHGHAREVSVRRRSRWPGSASRCRPWI